MFAETGALARLYSDALRTEVRFLHHFPSFVQDVQPAQGAGPVSVAYFGEARTEKGFEIFCDAMRGLAELHTGGEIRLVAQVYGTEVETAGMAAARNTLEQAVAHFGGEIFGVLEDEDYARRFAAADVVVLPYKLPNYRRRGSAVFVDALACGCIVVVRAGTWMSSFRQLENVVVFEDDADLVQKIELAVGRARDFSRKKMQQSSLFRLSAHVDALAARSPTIGRSEMSATKPSALILARFFPHTAAAQVFRSQAAMLLAAGFEVSVVTVADRDVAPGAPGDQWYRDEMRLPDVSAHWLCFTDRSTTGLHGHHSPGHNRRGRVPGSWT